MFQFSSATSVIKSASQLLVMTTNAYGGCSRDQLAIHLCNRHPRDYDFKKMLQKPDCHILKMFCELGVINKKTNEKNVHSMHEVLSVSPSLSASF